jgi:hypothetical protein
MSSSQRKLGPILIFVIGTKVKMDPGFRRDDKQNLDSRLRGNDGQKLDNICVNCQCRTDSAGLLKLLDAASGCCRIVRANIERRVACPVAV